RAQRRLAPPKAPRCSRPTCRSAPAKGAELLAAPFAGSSVRPYDSMPGNWRNGWINLYRFWNSDGFRNIHNLMEKSFQTFGPIYREKIGYYESVNIINPQDAAALFRAEGMFPERLKVQAWMAYRDYRKRKYGVLLKSGEEWRTNRLILNREVLSPKVTDNFVPLFSEVSQDFISRVYKQIQKSGRGSWTADLLNELFRFALESVCNVLYGERLGLLQDHIDPESQRFIDSVTMMFKTTSPMLYIPPDLLRRVNAKVWREHVEAWDVIFMHADRCIQNIYREFRLKKKNEDDFPGILSNLLQQDQLPIEDIKASVTELMAGGVDTTSTSLLWTLYELARNPAVQSQLRAEIASAEKAACGNLTKMLKSVPLLKAAIKETLRLHPVAVSLQRYTRQDLVIQNYLIPSGTLVQVGLYAMGRNPDVFHKPEKYDPERWVIGDNHFKGLGFGFGPRQCLGRRIAETEMQLFLIHILQNFKIETNRLADVKTTFDLILVPEKPIILTLRPLKGSP
uniref:Cholesterol side-chain cleavage enzyme, mitochondrial n=1 Tax=Latimeria chalumnae TaxID=7897 RepID=H3AS27_LATCH